MATKPKKKKMESTSTPAAPATKAEDYPAIHDLSQQLQYLRQVLQDDKRRIGFFVGAGCPLGVFDEEGVESIVLIPAVIELTKRIAEGLIRLDKETVGGSTLKAQWDSIIKECKIPGNGPLPTVEDALTEIRTLSGKRGGAKVLDMDKDALKNLDRSICKLILNEIDKDLPQYRCSYDRFASWVGGLHSVSAIEIFTPNYDLLCEQAFERQSIPHFDGFVGSREPFFDLASIEHDSIPARWCRVWKIHGSINWERVEEERKGKTITRVVRVTGKADAEKVMVYPSHLKYDQSRRMPYLAMLDRLRAFFLSQANSPQNTDAADGAPVLVICGYSFLDQHLNEVLLDGLRGNRRAHCFALMYSGLDKHPEAIECAEQQSNLTVLGWDTAVAGTRIGKYHPINTGEVENSSFITADSSASSDTNESIKYAQCRLGDFHFLGLFLEQLCGETL